LTVTAEYHLTQFISNGKVVLMEQKTVESDMLDPQRWGLPDEVVADLGNRLRRFWSRFRTCFKTKTRDASEHAWTYLRGLLGMETERNFANMARRVTDPDEDGQNLQQFMSDSPWPSQAVMQQVQREMAATPELSTGGMLILDESADEKAGDKSAGAGRQHNGRLGKVEMSQVGTFLAFANGVVWTWVDGELFLQEHWFTPEMAPARKRLGIPPERPFATKIELGWRMIQRVKANGLPFEAVACDDFYGRSGWLRRQMDGAGIVYMADVPENTQVYLTQPDFGLPLPQPGQRGPQPIRPRVLNEAQPLAVRQVVQQPDMLFQRFRVRHTERGELDDPFAMRRVWTIRDGGLAEEWLVIRHEGSYRYNYALSNAPADTPVQHLAEMKCARYFVERANQDAKSEGGWDELQAQKYRAWEHHLALNVLATWFVAQTKLDWAQTYPRDPALAQQMELEALPALSMANVREMLQAVLPLKHLSPKQATRLVVKHLVNRSRSTRSRWKAQRRNRGPT
jgi:SRSO17 transposase